MTRPARLLSFVAAGLFAAGTVPAQAWYRGGTTASGGRYGAEASNGQWAAGANGHYASGTYGTTSSGEKYATSSRGGSAEAQNGSWSSTTANGRTNSGTYGTTAYGTHYATGSYGGAVATNNGNVAATKNGQYAYGTHYAGTTAYGGAYHPPTVVNQYYGTGCYNCGGWGGAAAGAAVGATVGVAAGAAAASAAARPAYAPGTVYAALPGGCAVVPAQGHTFYNCGGTWFVAAYGANGVYYSVVPPP